MLIILALVILGSLAHAASPILGKSIEGEYQFNGDEPADINLLRVFVNANEITVVHVCGIKLARPSKGKTFDICTVSVHGKISGSYPATTVRGNDVVGTIAIKENNLIFSKQPKYDCPPLGDIGWPCSESGGDVPYQLTSKKPFLKCHVKINGTRLEGLFGGSHTLKKEDLLDGLGQKTETPSAGGFLIRTHTDPIVIGTLNQDRVNCE